MAAPFLGFGDRRAVLHVAAPLLTPANGARGVRLLCVLADTCCSLLFSREHGGSRGGFDVAPTLTEKLKQNRTAVSGDAHGPRWPALPLRVRCPQNETCVPPEAGRTGRGSPHQTRPSAPRPRPPRRQPPLSSQGAGLARRELFGAAGRPRSPEVERDAGVGFSAVSRGAQGGRVLSGRSPSSLETQRQAH